MITSIFIGVICLILQLTFAQQIEPTNARVAMTLLSTCGYMISLFVASHRYERLKSRIEALEKSKNKENC